MWGAGLSLDINAPVHGGDQNTKLGFGDLRDQRFTFRQLFFIQAQPWVHVHHDQKLVAALVKRQHLELETGRQHTCPRHCLPNGRIQLLAPCVALGFALFASVGGVCWRTGMQGRRNRRQGRRTVALLDLLRTAMR